MGDPCLSLEGKLQRVEIAAEQRSARAPRRLGYHGGMVRLALPGLLAPDHFVELGFEWRPDRVRYFAVVGGADRTLAELTDPARVPQLPAALMFNAWHPADHWFGDAAPPDYPAADATLRVDWARYWR